MSDITPSQRKMLNRIIDIEGGYKSKSRDGTHDPATLFGVIGSVWARLTKQTLNQAHKEMQSIGRYCEPYSTNTKNGTYHSHARPRQTLSAAEKNRYEAGREKALTLLHSEYLEAPGFDKYPEYIQFHLLDFGMNKGPSRARWALVDAMLKTGLLKEGEIKDWFKVKYDKEFTSENILTAKQSVSDEAFKNQSSGAWYGSGDDLFLLLAPKLEQLESEPNKEKASRQQNALIKAYGEARCSYYKARAAEQKAQTTHLDGWLNRVKEVDAFSYADIELKKQTSPQPTHITPPPAADKKASLHR